MKNGNLSQTFHNWKQCEGSKALKIKSTNNTECFQNIFEISFCRLLWLFKQFFMLQKIGICLPFTRLLVHQIFHSHALFKLLCFHAFINFRCQNESDLFSNERTEKCEKVRHLKMIQINKLDIFHTLKDDTFLKRNFFRFTFLSDKRKGRKETRYGFRN